MSQTTFLTDGSGYLQQPVLVRVSGTGGPWLQVELDGPTSSSSIQETPTYTVTFTYPRLPAGTYLVTASITSSTARILATTSRQFEVR